MDEENQNQGCFKSSKNCWKFVLAATISLGTTTFAMILLYQDKFANTALTSFATSTISANISYWMDSPNFSDKKNS